jgi:hypothetical protein
VGARARHQTTREVQRLALLDGADTARRRHARASRAWEPWHVVAAAVAGQILLVRALRVTRAR